MGIHEKTEHAFGGYDPEVTAQKLSRCPNPECQAPHPLSFDHWKRVFVDITVCPACGGPAGVVGEVKLASVHLNFPFVAKALMWIGAGLRRLAKRIEP